jgi:glutamine amidotransferase-like uncharacterized protein
MPLLNVAGRFKAIAQPASSYINESKTGTLSVAIPLKVSDGAQAGDEITAYLFISDNAVDRTAETLAEVFGYAGNFEDLYNGQCPFLGAECSITTEIEQYEGKPRCKVKWLNAAGSGGNGINKAEPDKFKALMSKFGRRAQAMAQNKLKELGKEPVTAPAAGVSVSGDDDLPF